MLGATLTDEPTTTGDPSPAPFGARGLRWTQDRADNVDLAVVDITGRRIRHLGSGVYAAGMHEMVWDGRDDDGRAVQTGAYFIAGQVGERRMSLKLMIVR